MGRPRVLLADDHALLLGAFEKLLATECDVVGQVADGRALVAAAEQLKPDVVVLDTSMPMLNGLEAGRQVKQAARDVAGVQDFDAQYARALEEVKTDAGLGKLLDVHSTPTFFIAGRRLPQAVQPQYLDVIIDLELKRAK